MCAPMPPYITVTECMGGAADATLGHAVTECMDHRPTLPPDARAPCPRITHRCQSYAFLTQNAGDIPLSMQGALRGWPSPTSSLPHEPECTTRQARATPLPSNCSSMPIVCISDTECRRYPAVYARGPHGWPSPTSSLPQRYPAVYARGPHGWPSPTSSLPHEPERMTRRPPCPRIAH
jgi:hypothetical protein